MQCGEEAVEQPDAADEVGALQGRFAPPSQLIPVLSGPQGSEVKKKTERHSSFNES